MSTHHWLQRRVPRVQIHDEEIGQLRGQDKIVSPSFGMEVHIVQVDACVRDIHHGCQRKLTYGRRVHERRGNRVDFKFRMLGRKCHLPSTDKTHLKQDHHQVPQSRRKHSSRVRKMFKG